MPKYEVNLARVHWFSVPVTAEDEETALDLAFDMAPGVSAYESGWGHEWTVDADDWMDVDDFSTTFNISNFDLKAVKLLSDEDEQWLTVDES